MNIKIKDVDLDIIDGIIIPVLEDSDTKTLEVQTIIKSGSFSGKKGELFYTTEITNDIKYKLYVGLGKKENFDGEVLRNSIAKAAKKAKELKLKAFAIENFDGNVICNSGKIKCIVEGVRLSLYTFNKYKSEKEEYNPDVYIKEIPSDKLNKANEILKEVNNLVDGIIVARNLVNEPANILYPESLANEVVKLGAENGFEVEILDEKQCKSLGMKAFLSVAQGSEKSPKLIVMRYIGDEGSSEVLGLVGKGLTYDSGGYSIKPTNSMVHMKEDMGGAAATIGAMIAISKNKTKKNVIGVIAACENMISHNAYRPGDIIGSMGGKTIEVLNTDAEGRLTLIDAITYIIEKEGATKIIDLATLTGAAITALGNYTTALMTNDDEFFNDFMESATLTGECFWRMPTFDHYRKQIVGSIADLKNVDSNGAGTIVAGMFIKEFVQDKPWIHLDIAGTASTKNPISEYVVKGGTGVPVSTLYYFAKGKGDHSKKEHDE